MFCTGGERYEYGYEYEYEYEYEYGYAYGYEYEYEYEHDRRRKRDKKHNLCVCVLFHGDHIIGGKKGVAMFFCTFLTACCGVVHTRVGGGTDFLLVFLLLLLYFLFVCGAIMETRTNARSAVDSSSSIVDFFCLVTKKTSSRRVWLSNPKHG